MTCTKVRYPDQLTAERALASAMLAGWRGKPKRREQRVYACHLCGGWHLTSQPKRRAA